MKLETILKRKSVRTFDGKGLSNKELEDINNIINNLDNPFDLNIRFVLLDKDKYNLESPVIVGEKYYICAIIDSDNYLALGYIFEDLIMKLEEIDIANVIIAGTYKKDNFIKALDLKENEKLALISPIGHKADKMSFRETLMRKGIKADERLGFDKLFFKDNFNNPINEDNEYKDCLNAVRYSPSAVNKQPWRILINDSGFHFYKNETKGYEKIQLIDMGIALRNFTFVCNSDGKILYDKPDIDSGTLQYIISYIF